MAETLFSNLVFFADLNADNIRMPLPTTANPDPEIEPEEPTGPPPEIPDPVEPDPEIPPEQPDDPDDPDPDPGIPGDIGPVTGVVSNTIGNAPTITRGGSSEIRDIFIQQGQTLTLTYKASQSCFMIRGCGFSGMKESWNAAGDELTITWPVPAHISSQSTYIGVIAETYGGKIEFFERLHIGKTLADLFFCGYNEPKSLIGPAVDTIPHQGATLIVRDGYYDGDENIISVGRHNDTPYGMGCPNGVHTIQTLTITENQFGVPVTRQENVVRVQKYTTIMAETPMGVVIDRKHKRIAIKIDGNEPPSPNLGNNDISGHTQYAGGGRTARGIIVEGIAVRNCREFSTYIAGARKCFIRTFSNVDGTVWGPQSDNEPVVSGTFLGSAEDGGFMRGSVLAHARLLNNNGRSHKGVWRQMIATSGATQQREDNQAITFISYWGFRARFDNCIVIDDYFFWRGITPGSGTFPFTNGAFLSNRGFTDIFQARGPLVYNSVRLPWMSDRSGQRLFLQDLCQDGVFWKHMGGAAGGGSNTYNGPAINRGPCVFKNVTAGRSTSTEFNASMINGWGTTDGLKNEFDGVLLASPSWDYASNSSDIVMISPTHIMKKVAIVNPPARITPEFQQLAQAYLHINAADSHVSGSKYITRIEPGSLLAEQNIGCQNYWMRTHGQFGDGWNDPDFDTIYEENWISRIPMIRMMQERRYYYCVSNGIPFSGDVGCSREDQHITDYVNSEGTTPQKSRVTPYVVDIYVYQVGDTVYCRWRMPAPAYRSTMVGVDVFIDNLRVAQNLPLSSMGVELRNVNKGLRTFYVVIKDSVYGDSGPSTQVKFQVTAVNEYDSEGPLSQVAALAVNGGTYAVTDTILPNGLTVTAAVFSSMTRVKPKVKCHITRPDMASGASLRLTSCRNMHITGFELSKGLWPAQMYDCKDIWISGNYIHDAGQEFVQFYMLSDGVHQNYQVVDNNMIRSGLTNPQYGEGVYIGVGSNGTSMWGPISNVRVAGNFIKDITAEGVDIKDQVIDAIIEDNVFENVDLAFNGVIVIGADGDPARPGNFIVRRNTTRNVTNRNGYEIVHMAVGRGNTEIYDNFFDGESGNESGIVIFKTSNNDTTNQVKAYNNRFGEIYGWRRVRINSTDGGTGLDKPLTFVEVAHGKPMLKLDASMLSSLGLTGANVTQWKDQSELLFHATQNTSGKYPQTGIRQISAKNALSFDGSAHFLRQVWGPTYIYSSMTFAVVDIDTKDSVERIFEVADNTNSRISMGVGPSGCYYQHGNTFTPVYIEAGTGKMLIAAYKTGTKIFVQAKGLTMTNNTAGSTVIAGNVWSIGCYGNGVSGFFDGAIAEIRTYDYYDATDFASIIAELRAKWGVT